MSQTRQRRSGGGRGAVTLADQLVSSASNFALGVLIARTGGPAALGTFGVAFLVWLVVVGTNRALVNEPMTVGGSLDSGDAELREGLLASLVLGAGVTGLLGVAGTVMMLAGFDAALAVLALAPWILSLLVQEYCRSMAFRLQRPDFALISDVVFAVAQGIVTVALILLHIGSVSTFLASWGIGATAGGLVGMALLGVRASGRGGAAHLRALWPRSRWFLAEFGVNFAGNQGYLFLLPVLIGTAEFGVFRAGASLIGPMMVVFIAGGNVALPECVRRLRQDDVRGLAAYTPRLTAVVVALTVLYCSVVGVLAVPMLRLVYGEKFTGAGVITQLVAADYVLTAVGFGCGVAMKATNQMRRLWALRAASAAVSITGVVVLTSAFGLPGAGLATVLAGGTYTVGVILAYRQMCRRALSGRAGEGRQGGKCSTPASPCFSRGAGAKHFIGAKRLPVFRRSHRLEDVLPAQSCPTEMNQPDD